MCFCKTRVKYSVPVQLCCVSPASIAQRTIRLLRDAREGIGAYPLGAFLPRLGAVVRGGSLFSGTSWDVGFAVEHLSHRGRNPGGFNGGSSSAVGGITNSPARLGVTRQKG